MDLLESLGKEDISLMFDSDSTRASHDSTRIIFWWLWLDADSKCLWFYKYHSDTCLLLGYGEVVVYFWFQVSQNRSTRRCHICPLDAWRSQCEASTCQ